MSTLTTSDKFARRPAHLPPIDEAQVFAAANKLKAEKKIISIDTVREELLGGSRGTIAPLLRKWKEEQENRYQLSIEEIPEEAEEAGLLATKAIWKIASQLASTQLKEMGKTLLEKEEAHKKQLEEYEATMKQLEEQRDAVASAHDQATATLMEKNSELTALHTKLVEANQMLSLSAMREQEALRQRDRQEAELKEVRDDAAKIARDCMKFEGLVDIEKADREKAEAQLVKAQESIRVLSEQVPLLQQKLSAEQQKLAVEQQKNRGLSEQVLTLREQLDTERETYQKTLETLRLDHTALQQAMNDLWALQQQTMARADQADALARQAEADLSKSRETATTLLNRAENAEAEIKRLLMNQSEARKEIPLISAQKEILAEDVKARNGITKPSKKGASHAATPNT